MKKVILISTIISSLVLSSCNSHPDGDGFYTKEEVSKHCDFDLTETNYKILKTNGGVLYLVDRKYEDKIIDGNGRTVSGLDTCYLKMRAFRFWMNEIVKTK